MAEGTVVQISKRRATRVLDDAQRTTLMALGTAVIPPGKLHGGYDDDSADRFEAWLAAEPPNVVRGLRALLTWLEHSTRTRHASGFSALSFDDRVQHMERLSKSWLPHNKAVFSGLTVPVKSNHFDEPTLHRLMDAPFGVTPPTAIERAFPSTQHIDGREVKEDETIECDVVVVGSGAGGAAFACELARRGLAVAMVEGGRYFTRQDFDGRPLQSMRRLFLEGGLTVGLGNLGLPIWAGKTVGGSTTINSGTCVRTPTWVLAEWRRDLGLDELREDALAPDFEKVEAMLGVREADRRYLGSIADVIARGADRLGLTHHPLRRNAPDCDGQGLCFLGCPTGAKRSTDVSYVPAALKHGALLYSSTDVRGIDIEDGRAVGVTAKTDGGATLTFRARATAIAGGALLTPLLLKRSGLKNRWIGRNLSIHPCGKVLALMPEIQDMWHGIPQGYTIDSWAREGVLFEGASLPLSAAASGLSNVGPRYTELMESYRHLSLFGFLVRDRSRGRVFERPNGGPAILYQMNERDAELFRRALALLSEVYLEAGATSVFPGVAGAPEIRSSADLAAFKEAKYSASRFEATAYHPLGTARMAKHPDHGVVGPDHASHEVRDLYVVDGAAVPTSLGVNPQVTIMALALRAAGIVSKRLS
jgi:choline dehydrogenase-like flavoprotein